MGRKRAARSRVCSRQTSRWTRSWKRERVRRAADLKNSEHRLRLCRIIQAQRAFADAGNGFAFELQRKSFLHPLRVAGKIFKSRRAQLRRVHEPERAEAVLARRSEEHTSELQSLRHLVCRL